MRGTQMHESHTPLDYRKKVVQDKLRIKSFMQAQPKEVQQDFANTKATTRFSVDSLTILNLVDVAVRKKLCSMGFVAKDFDFKKGITVQVGVYSEQRRGTQWVDVRYNPVQVSKDVFICVDSAEPLVISPEGSSKVNLVVYSTAGNKGHWTSGVKVEQHNG